MSSALMNSMAMAGAHTSVPQTMSTTMAPMSAPSVNGRSMAGSGNQLPLSMSNSLSGVQNAWGLPPASQSLAPSYARQQQPYTSGQGSMPSAGSSRSATRHVSPNSVYAIDGQDWYLKDAVSWQQNFEAWNNMASGAGGPSSGQNYGPNNANGTSGAAPSDSMFMFRGMPQNEMNSSGFDLFGSMDTLDHLPGLD
jgi:hypothetical protein